MDRNTALSERLRFLGLDHSALATLKAMKRTLMLALPEALEIFYAKAAAEPRVSSLFSGPAAITHAKGQQRSHWDMISEGQFDQSYLSAVTKVGNVHAAIGLEPRWYIAGYAIIFEQLVVGVLEARLQKKTKKTSFWSKFFGSSKKNEARDIAAEVGVLAKATFLDMDIAISVYLEALEVARVKDVAHTRSTIGTKVGETVGVALAALAEGDLTARIGDDIPEDFVRLRHDFNAAAEKLQGTMKAVAANAQGVRSGAAEITQASDDLSRRTEQQAASLEQTAAALHQITTTVHKTAEAATEARNAATVARADTERSNEVLRETIGAMNGIETSSSQIAQIIGVIDEIAFQTNLLALNAGIEAARAGDAGRGFAVVATEVRALAQRSASAAKEIKELIAASGQQVETGVKLVGETGKALGQIVEQVTRLSSLISDIAASAQEQATGLSEVNTAVNHMDQVTQQNAAMVEETTAASYNLDKEASELAQLIGQFRIGQVQHPHLSVVPNRKSDTMTMAKPRIPVHAPTYKANPPSTRAAAESWNEF